MGASKTLFLMMQQEQYLEIPAHIRAAYLADKVYKESDNDFEYLMEDKIFRDLIKEEKKSKEAVLERKAYLRDKKRKL